MVLLADARPWNWRFRWWVPDFSRDLREIAGLPAKVREGFSPECVSVLVLGNSLTLHGFDQAMICSDVSKSVSRSPVKFTFVVFQGAYIMPEMYRIVTPLYGLR